MSKFKKLCDRFLACPTDFTWAELVTMLDGCGFALDETGNGSRCKFVNREDAALIISVHKPHPRPTVKPYIMREIKQMLTEQGII